VFGPLPPGRPFVFACFIRRKKFFHCSTGTQAISNLQDFSQNEPGMREPRQISFGKEATLTELQRYASRFRTLFLASAVVLLSFAIGAESAGVVRRIFAHVTAGVVGTQQP